MTWRRCAQGILAFLVALGLAVSGLTALGGRAAPAVVATIPVGAEPFAIAVNPTTNRIYVPNVSITGPGGSVISVIDGATNTVVATISLGTSSQPQGVAVNPTTNRVYTTYYDSGTNSTIVVVIDGATNTVTTTIPINGASACCGLNPFDVAVDPTTNRVYVAVQGGSPGVAVIDGAANTVTTTVPLPGPAVSVAVNLATNRVYATYQAVPTPPAVPTLALAVIDGGTNTVVTSVPLPGTSSFAYGVAVNPIMNRVYVTSATTAGPGASGNLIVLDGGSNAIIATVPLTTDPIGVAVNATTGTVYVTSFNIVTTTPPQVSGSLTVVDGGTNAVTATVPLNGATIGVAVNPRTGFVYVTNFDFTNPSNSSVAVFGERKVGLSASALAFGNQPVGMASAAQTVTLTNTGQVPVDVSGIAIAGANSADFVKTSDTCTAATLAAGATCAVGVAFAPTAVGNRSATLLVTDDAAGSPQQVALSGAGTPAPVGWSAWQSLGGVLTDSPAAAGLNGSLYVFAAGTDHALYVRSSADGSAFTNWRSLGGFLTAAPAAASNNGTLYVFAKGSDNALYVMSTADGTNWTGWTRLGGILTAPPAATSVNGTLYVLAKGSDNALYVMHSTDGATWSGWQNLGGVLTAAPTAAGLNGTLYVFAKGTDNALYQRSSANGVEYTDWQSLGGVLTAAPAAASFNPTGGVATLYTFATGTDNALYVRSTTDGATWSAWLTLGGQLVGPPAAAGVGNTLYAVVRWNDNTLYERFLR
ncbi:MAG TPA: choice-of-anchor D domain-containing protein [Thermomicrobiales bacterium]|nr:choice-of-anchor D domain-containing protein [Thermomicrobiales bacterium]